MSQTMKKKVTPRQYLGIENKYLAKTFPTEWKEYQALSNKWYSAEPNPPYKPSTVQKTITQHLTISEVSHIGLAELLDLCTEKEIPIQDVGIRGDSEKYDSDSHILVIYHKQEVPNPTLTENQKYHDKQMIIYNDQLAKYEKADALFQIKRDRVTELMKLFDQSLKALLDD